MLPRPSTSRLSDAGTRDKPAAGRSDPGAAIGTVLGPRATVSRSGMAAGAVSPAHEAGVSKRRFRSVMLGVLGQSCEWMHSTGADFPPANRAADPRHDRP